LDEADDRRDPEAAQFRQPFVVPGPVALRRVVRRHPLPRHGVAQGADAEAGDGFEVRQAAVVVPGFAELVAQVGPDAHHAAFQPAPQLGPARGALPARSRRRRGRHAASCVAVGRRLGRA
jgi:hypothetical protein